MKKISQLLFIIPLSLCFTAVGGCDEESEFDSAEDTTDSEGDDDGFRWSTARLNYPMLVTSMNADTYGGNNGGCLDTDPSGSVRSVRQYRCHGQDNQLWLFESVPGGFSIHSEDDDGLCLDVPGFNFSSGQTVQMYPCNGGINQVWRTFGHDLESATIRPAANTNLCLDVRGNVKTNSAAIQLNGCNGGANQAWRFHDWAGDDHTSCDWSIRFGAQGPVVSPGQRRSFAVSGHNFDRLCSKDLAWDHIDCPSWANWFVVDSPWGSDDFNVRCFNK